MILTAYEVASVLRDGIVGRVRISLVDPERTWDRAFCGDVEFRFGDALIVIFNDCNELDYVDNARIGDREGDFDDWAKEVERETPGPNPLDLLTAEEYAALERIVEEAR